MVTFHQSLHKNHDVILLYVRREIMQFVAKPTFQGWPKMLVFEPRRALCLTRLGKSLWAALKHSCQHVGQARNVNHFYSVYNEESWITIFELKRACLSNKSKLRVIEKWPKEGLPQLENGFWNPCDRANFVIPAGSRSSFSASPR